jgi:Ran GTPase-activating protein (RanGAP) involved in mRNA processing and transport
MLKQLENLLLNKNIIFVLGVLTFLYTVFAGPELPEGLAQLLNNNVVKTLAIFTVAYLSSAKDGRIALFSTIVFILVTNFISEKSLYEKFNNYKYMESFQNEEVPDEDNDKEDEDAEEEDEVKEEVMEEQEESGEKAEEEELVEEKSPLKLKLQCTAIEEAFRSF